MEGRLVRETEPGRSRGRKLSGTSDSVRHAGAVRSEHRKALERLPVQQNPMGAAGVVKQTRWSRDRSNTLRRRLDAVWSAQPPRAKAREGTSRGESSCDGLGMTCSEGGLERPGTMAMEPGRTGSSAFEPAELATSYSSEFEADEHRGRKGAAAAETRSGLPVRKVFRVGTPGAAADLASPQGRGESKPSRG
jgi:hypothetical protein